MEFASYFKHFLEKTVNLNQSRIDKLDDSVAAVTSYLENEAQLGPIVIEVIPQGSYAHKTIIKPVGNHEFDADVLLHVEEQTGWSAREYVEQLHAAFSRSGTYKPIVKLGSRCVTVNYANDFHIDVVPYLERAGGDHWITNRPEDLFELTDPEQFNAWLIEQNEIAKNHLVEVIRLVKYLRDFKQTFSIKSVVLTTLLGEAVSEWKLWNDANYYKNMPTALLHIVGDLDAFLQANPTMPAILDPAGTGENFSDRCWTEEKQYATFREKMHYYATKIAAAYAEADEAKSLAIWQEIFGSDFKEPPLLSSVITKSLTPVTERFLDRDFNIRFSQTHYTLRLDARILPKKGFRTLSLSARGGKVEKDRKLRFTIADCNVPAPYDVYWKVRNKGPEAASANQLRGEIKKDPGLVGAHKREEHTAYRGSHYVECYVVKNGVCVVSRRQPVNVV